MLRVLVLTAFLFLCLAVTCWAESLSVRRRALAPRPSDPHPNPSEYRFRPPISGGVTSQAVEDVHLMDIVLVASVDGKFHALNRTSGHTLWSMSSASAFAGAAPSTLGPLVRTSHINSDADTSDDDDSSNQELYVIEPQSGDIYVMASPSSPLQRLAFSMSQLVDMSPFSFSVDEDRRVFVGRKETSLFSIELETGKVLEVNSECPWDPFEDLNAKSKEILDLDELEGTDPIDPAPPSTRISIGRTDYHIAIHTRPTSPSAPKPPIQNLSFSVYGPNNRDNSIQTSYQRSADDTYVQSFPNGDLFSFKTADKAMSEPAAIDALWSKKFTTPVVAVFDIVKTPEREQPFVLLQPRPRLEDSVENFNHAPNLRAAYVGLVQESGSLFAMTPQRFPLVAFGDNNEQRGLRSDVDAITERRKFRDLCRNGASDRRCLTGVRQLEESTQSWRSMLDAVPSSAIPSGASTVMDANRESALMPEPEKSLLAGGGSGVMTDALLPWVPSNDGYSKPATILRAPSILVSILFAVFITALWVYRKFKAVRVQVKFQFEENTKASIGSKDANAPLRLENSTMSGDKLGDIPAFQKSPLTPSPISVPEAPLSVPSSSSPSSTMSDTYVLVNADGSSRSSNGKDTDMVQNADEPVDGDESERDGDNIGGEKRKGAKKKRRGKKKKPTLASEAAEGDEEKEVASSSADVREEQAATPSSPLLNLVIPSTPQLEPSPSSLIISDTVLGFGSHGTVVFSGSLQGRAVAVKRLLQDFVTLASREVSILQESDDHPNVIRYYYQESHANFLYIALELCPASLADIIESPDKFRDISAAFDPKRALRQITSGLRHLHSLKLIHRDIKPQNILISAAKKNGGRDRGHRMLISDFGLCKKLDLDQTSFLPTAHGAMAAGTVGWRAPEILRGEVKLDDSLGDDSQSSRGSVGTPSGTPYAGTGKPTRLTKLVDIFALGCLFYYVLSSGSHPYGDRFEREINILKDVKSLDGLERFGEEGTDAVELITSMLRTDAPDRPDTTSCLLHPFFWDQGRRLNFLQDASDRFEIMCRDPKDPHLITLEKGAVHIVGADWHTRLDKIFIENLGKFRKYDGKSVQDLLRAIRNKKHHYQDLPDNVKRHLGPMPEGFLSYFTRRFPRLFLHVHSVIAATALRQESMFRTYFELVE